MLFESDSDTLSSVCVCASGFSKLSFRLFDVQQKRGMYSFYKKGFVTFLPDGRGIDLNLLRTEYSLFSCFLLFTKINVNGYSFLMINHCKIKLYYTF